MKVVPTELSGVVRIEPDVYGDERGFFMEAWSERRYAEHGIAVPFVQDNLSRSAHGVVRGLHLQHPHDQGKLVQVLDGEVFDVAVDVRVGSPTFGRWVGVILSSRNKHQLYVPPGFAHGFCVTGDHALVAYKATAPYHPEAELGVAWDDPALGISWPIRDAVVSAKDRAWPRLGEIPPERLPRHGSLASD